MNPEFKASFKEVEQGLFAHYKQWYGDDPKKWSKRTSDAFFRHIGMMHVAFDNAQNKINESRN